LGREVPFLSKGIQEEQREGKPPRSIVGNMKDEEVHG